MKECNFAGQMENVSRFFFLVTLLICAGTICGAPSEPLLKGSENFSVFEENGKVGLKNQEGVVLIPAEYEAMGWSNGRFSIIDQVTGYRSNGLWGLINISNNRVTPAEYIDLSPGEGSLIVGRKKIPGSVKVHAGCINTSGKEKIPFEYDGLRTSSLRAIVYIRKGARFNHGLVDYENNVLIPIAYRNIYPLGSLRYGVENYENKTAIFSEDGRQLTGFDIDSLSEFRKNFAIIYQDQLQGLIDREGKIRVEPLYREIKINDDGLVSARKPDEWTFLSGDNRFLRSVHADSVSAISKTLLKIKTGNTIRLTTADLDPAGNLPVSSIGAFEKGKAVVNLNDRVGIMDEEGKIIIDPSYNDLVIDDHYYLANKTIHNRKRWILLDDTGRVVSRASYGQIAAYNGKFFPVKNRGYWGGMNTLGREIIACVHDSLINVSNERVVVKFKGQYGIIDLHESWLVTPQPHKLEVLNDTLYLVRTGKTTFLKSMNGELIYFSDNLLEVRDDHLIEHLPSGGAWMIDFTGVIRDREILPVGIQWMSREVSEGFRAIKKDNRFGFVDGKGRLRIANRYEEVRPFSESRAAVRILGRWGFIDDRDQLVVQPVYDDITPFRQGMSKVRQKDQFGVIDASGKVLLQVRYDDVVLLDDNRYKFRQDGSWGMGDSMARVFVSAKYDNLSYLDNGNVIVSRDGKYGLLNRYGVSTIPMQYDGLSYDPFHDEYIALKKAEWAKLDL